VFSDFSKLSRYGVALALTARLVLEPMLRAVAPFLMFSLAVMVSAWYGGFGPGILATVVSEFIGDYFFIYPTHTFEIAEQNLAQKPELGLFLIIGATSSLLGRERKLSEERRRQLLSRESEAREAAEKANRYKDEFLAAISHELRTPLTAILGWSSILLKGRLDHAKSVQAVETIERNAKIQLRLVEDLLDVSRFISGNVHIESELVRLTPVIAAAADMVRPLANAKKAQLALKLDPAADRVVGDPVKLQQVVWHLLSNAVKFTPAEGYVEVTLGRVGPNARIAVRDTGRGINPEFLPHVFERFRQADSKVGGVGLGLAIARSLVEHHGGSIEAQSPGDGQGATFAV
jgi:signal transduction histidine kinase